jgi:hypothetical protein
MQWEGLCVHLILASPAQPININININMAKRINEKETNPQLYKKPLEEL